MNHTFENIHSIVCWDIDVKNGEKVVDLAGEERTMKIAPADRMQRLLPDGNVLTRKRTRRSRLDWLLARLRDMRGAGDVDRNVGAHVG